MATPIDVEAFHHDGRGPELRSIHWRPGSAQLLAIDYSNPDDDHSTDELKHVYFVAPQVVRITLEEVIGKHQLPVDLLSAGRAAFFDMGRTEWLESYDQRHLTNCRHFKLLFYEELVDVICEGVECRTGGFDTTRL